LKLTDVKKRLKTDIGNRLGQIVGQNKVIDDPCSKRTDDGLGLHLVGADSRHIGLPELLDGCLQGRIGNGRDDPAIGVKVVRQHPADRFLLGQRVAVQGLTPRSG